MKAHTIVWTLAWDNESGTDCLVFGTEAECMSHLRKLIEHEIAEIEDEDADKIRQLLVAGKFGAAYEHWQATFKSELDTYNWGSQPLELDLEPVSAFSQE